MEDKLLIEELTHNQNIPCNVEAQSPTKFPVHLSYFNWKSGNKNIKFANIILDGEEIIPFLRESYADTLVLNNNQLSLSISKLVNKTLKTLVY